MTSHDLNTADISLIIEMAWSDDTSFEAIALQFGLAEPQVIALMKQQLKAGSYQAWRKRVNGRQAKHESRRLVMIQHSFLIAGSIAHED
ncbi:MAG: TIGR03643 family protein [Pseudomonadota bacterium]